MTIPEADIRLIELLARRLERLSADSKWAHRASGVRGQLLRLLEQLDAGELVGSAQVQALIDSGFTILKRAAREIA